MHVALIEPPVVRPKNETATGIECEPPMALMGLGAVLKSGGHSVQVIDAVAGGYDERERVNDWLVRLGLGFEKVAGRIDPSVELIGISCNFFFNHPTCLDLARFLKARFPQARFLLGGVAPTALFESILADANADFVALREADDTLPLLLEHLDSPEHVPGIAWRDSSGEIRVNRQAPLPLDLDRYPIPDRDLVDLHLYHRIGRPFGFVKQHRFGTTLLTSRGCPARCTFCTAHLVHGRRFRCRSAAGVLSEIEFLVENKGIRELRIIDETFTLDKERAHAILDGVIKRGYGDRLSFTCPNGLSIQSLDEALIDKMAAANFHSVALAVESGDQQVASRIVRKPIDLDKAERIIRHFMDHTDILVCGYYIIGFPGETKAQILKTLEFANRMNTHNATVSILMPYPYTDVYAAARDAGQLLLDENNRDFYYRLMPKYGVIRSNEFTPEWLHMIQETDRFLALHRKRRRSIPQLAVDLVRRNRWRAPQVAAMVLYHAAKGDMR